MRCSRNTSNNNHHTFLHTFITHDKQSLMFLDGLFDSFDEYTRNNNVTDRDNGIIFDRSSNAVYDKSYRIKPEQEQHTALSV